MENTTTRSSFSFMQPYHVKLDRFDGTNFTRWQDKMIFLLTALKISYILDPELQPFPEPSENDTDQIKADRKKREEDELMCRGHILNTLSDRLYDLYTPLKSPKEIWHALESKYKTEKIGTDKFLIMKYFDFKMIDTLSVLDQVHDLQILVSKLRDLSVKIPEALQVGAIITKLPPSWNDYRKKLLHQTEETSLEKLGQHLRIEEENRIRDGVGPSSFANVNAVDQDESKKYDKHLKPKKNKGFKRKVLPTKTMRKRIGLAIIVA
ncbi:uncharacterized protein LOC119986939 [Tripterygium wilfordii]|uniref:uncharacterized protein LOC119986939 n=1 Tax=Tripterygium wilfordii TaxID=458696 RepID=UPI0018F8383B|nr:uncharacterized protein LOC119986939 [Tripterygium wilfordii]